MWKWKMIKNMIAVKGYSSHRGHHDCSGDHLVSVEDVEGNLRVHEVDCDGRERENRKLVR